MPEQVPFTDPQMAIIETVHTDSKTKRLADVDRKLLQVQDPLIRQALQQERTRIENENFAQFVRFMVREYVRAYEVGDQGRIAQDVAQEFSQARRDRILAREQELRDL